VVSSGCSVVIEMHLTNVFNDTNGLLVPRTCCLDGYPCEGVGDGKIFEFATLLTADPAWAEVAYKCKSANVYGMVTSHAMGFLGTTKYYYYYYRVFLFDVSF